MRMNDRERKHGDRIDNAAAFLIGFACAAAAIGHWFGLW